MKTWWIVEYGPRRLYIGKVYATLAEIKAALGPYVFIEGNCAHVFGRPSEDK